MNDIWAYLRAHHVEIESWTVSSVYLASAPLVVGIVLALPAGWIAHRYRWTYPPVLGLAGVLYTVPSLVMFLALPGLLGTRILDPVNVAVALTVYTFALLVRTVADGLSSVSSDVLAAASAVGHGGRQLLLRVHLPLATPVIAAGVRVAAVSNISLTSVASVIGTSQLGQLFIAGTSTESLTPIVLGLVLFLAMAGLLDLVILGIARRLTPWHRAAMAA